MTRYHLKTLNCQQVMHEVLDLKKRPELQFYWTSICSLPDIGNAVFQKAKSGAAAHSSVCETGRVGRLMNSAWMEVIFLLIYQMKLLYKRTGTIKSSNH